jgi:hypothetical protein
MQYMGGLYGHLRGLIPRSLRQKGLISQANLPARPLG